MSDTFKFDILKKAGVTQGTFAALVGASRTTVNTWAKGLHSPTPKARKRVSVTLHAIADLVRQGHLPLKRGVNAAQVEVIKQQIGIITPAE